ncbi:MAG: 5-carboxymethyl-2-hydroxymuconate Delta-isomerase [Gammaproteobacteria bacterium]|nr:5-carboxymethyl-2-hydroxymuconate Delta-isomerase [Gammaproteobacteria bacterium]
MPHIIIEYADLLGDDTFAHTLCITVHQAIAESGLFEASHIKTRAYPFKTYTHAGGEKPYIHIQARIKSGRDSQNKKQLSDAIIDKLKLVQIQDTVVTVEIIDMDRESYGKFKAD